ncbi:MAG: hypothetical protein JJ959_12070 [Nisaea sp.]|uniref:hypothetical protein n=1 Tax=Nisaea sp. TaxID=2024842 RepID=UPI001AFEA59A|nr:hypothetical protein [Nisaea sp.]MBO6561270.1 hypothetical protein [Nisaea sp.]
MAKQSQAKPLISSVIWPAFIAVSILWIGAFAWLFLDRWSEDLAPVERTYMLQEQTCKAAYRETEARDRCILIMELDRFQSRSIMIANRVLACASLPLIGFGILVYLGRRRTGKKGQRT